MWVALLVACGWPAAAVWAQQVPLPEWVRSGEVNDDGAVVYIAPDERARRRGTIALGTRLPIVARTPGAGCGDFRFVQVGVDAFICEHDLSWSREEPAGVAQPVLPTEQLLPFEYRFVVADGLGGYATLNDVDADDFAVVFARDFGVVVSARARHQGQDFVRTQHGYYLREDALRARRVSQFAGVAIGQPGVEDLAWVIGERAQRFSLPAAGKAQGLLPRLSRVQLTQHPPERGERAALQQGGHVALRELARPRPTVFPADLAPGERWFDIDTATQILVVYEEQRPVFATLVSTGRAGNETPKGEFRVWAKLATSDMNDTERYDVDYNYSIESVPWVLYFHEDIALHAAFWHERFGQARSRGCVNLSPRDARRIFELSAPALPDGYYAVLSTPSDPGTRVVVR